MEVRFVTHINAQRGGEYKVRLRRIGDATTVKSVLVSLGLGSAYTVIHCTVDFTNNNGHKHKPIYVLEDVPLRVQIDAAGAAISEGLDIATVCPTLNVYLDDTIETTQVKRSASGGKRERSNGFMAPLVGLGKSARGGGARRGPARIDNSNRHRRRSHVEAAAAIAAEAKLGRYNGHSSAERTKAARPGKAEKKRLDIPASSLEGMELYIVPNTFPAAKLSYAQSTMYCALCGSLAAEQAAFIAPRAEIAFEKLLSATAVILAALAAAPTQNKQRLALNPLAHLISANLAAAETQSKINTSSNTNPPNKAIYSLKNSPILPLAPIATSINAGSLWTMSKTRKDIAKLAKVVDILFAHPAMKRFN